MPLAHTSLMRRLVIRRLLLYASLCALLVGHQYTVHGATASVAGMYGAGSSDESETSLYVLGLSAPAANNVSPYTYTTQSLSANAATVSSVFSQFNGESACMAILGPAGGQLLKYIYASTNNLVFTTPLFSPLLQTMNKQTNGGLYPSYNEKVYWLLPSDQAQASGLMFFLAQRPLVPLNQILLAYTDDGISVSSVTLLTGIAPVLGITGLSMQTTGGQSFSTATYSSVFPTAPHIVYQLLESAFTYSIDWIGQMVSDSNFIKANTTIGTTITFDYITLQAYTSKASSTAVLPPSNILTASPVPGIGSTEYQAATDFATEASSTISSISTDAEKNFVMAGWAGGTALMQALNMYSGPTFGAKSTFYNVLSNQQLMFLTSDLFYGTMGPSSVSNTAQSQGAINECRWAGNNVWFHTLKKSGSTYDSTPVHGALFQYAFGTCGNLNSAPTPSQFALPRTIHVVGFSPSDNDMISSMCSQTVSAIETVANTNLFWHHSSHAYRGYCLPTSISSASSDWSTHQSTYVTTSLMGVIPDAIVTSSPPSSLILDFMPQTTQLHVAKQNFVYLFPTLEQELYVLASYLGGVVTSTSVVCAVVSSSTYSDDITTLLKKTLTTFGITPSSGNVNQPTGALSSSISASCTHTFVIGAASTDAAGILGVMQQQSTSIVLMSFEDLTKQYAAFASAFASAGTAVTNRLVFATNLPMWTGNTMSSGTLSSASALSTVGEFVETLSPAAQTPAAARAFIVAMLYDQLTIGTSWGQPNMQNALYGNRTVHVGGMTFGPFKVTWGTESLINYGACDISVMSYSRVVDPSTPPLSQPTNPSLVYSASTSTAVVAAAVDASEQSCVELQQSSSLSGYVPPPTTPQPGESTTTRTTTTSTPATNSAGHSSSAVDQKLKDFLSALVVLLVVLVLYILLLLLLRFGVLQAVWDCLVSLPCCRCCRDESDENAVRDAGKVRAAIDEELREDRRLEYEALDISPPSESVSLELTVVFLEVEQWRSLWARQPEVMSRVERHYQRCVRRAALKHQVYGMPPCEGLWVFVCPSSDVGVKFAQSVVKDVSKCNRSDGSVVSGEYSRLGCGNSAVKGLRLLVAVHRGAATRYAGASGRPCYRGAAVSGAVGAAYAAGAAGLVVLTASALTDSGLSAESKEVQSVAAQPDKQQYVEEALYALSVVHSSGPRPFRRSSENEEVDEVKSTVFFVDAASRSGDGGLQPWCVKRFEAHYETIPEQERIADLRCLAELFTLSGALSETRGGPADYNVLLQSVSGQVASMMECRHGFTRAATHPPPPEGHSKGTPIPMVSSRAAREEGVGFLERTRPQTSVAAGDRRTYRRRSEHRHHSYVDDDMDSAED